MNKVRLIPGNLQDLLKDHLTISTVGMGYVFCIAPGLQITFRRNTFSRRQDKAYRQLVADLLQYLQLQFPALQAKFGISGSYLDNALLRELSFKVTGNECIV